MLSFGHHTRSHAIHREASLDLVRGIAVILMILSHSIYFFHDGTNASLSILLRTGNTLAFTLFLFVSAASSYITFLFHPESITAEEKHHIRKRTIIILVGYWALATVGALKDLPVFTLSSAIEEIIRVLLFMRVPSFTEFLIPFIAFPLVILLAKGVLRTIARNIYLTILVAVGAYIISVLLFPLSIPTPWLYYKSLLVGEEGILRFPLLSYTPVFLFGLYWGHIVSQHGVAIVKMKFAMIWATLFTFSALCATFANMQLSFGLLSPLQRWPPSIGFLSIGLAVAFSTCFILSLMPKPEWSLKSWRFLDYLGRDAYDLFLTHMFVLFGYQMVSGPKHTEPLWVITNFLVLFILSVIVSSLNWKSSPSFITIGPISFGSPRVERIKKRYLLAGVTMVLLVGILLNADRRKSTTGESMRKRDLGFASWISVLTKDREIPWTYDNYGFRRQIRIENTNDQNLTKGRVAHVKLDHRQFVIDKKSRSNGKDLFVVYRKDGRFHVVPTNVSSPNTDSASLQFQLVEPIGGRSTDTQYFLYYGSDFAIERTPLIHQNDMPDISTVALLEESIPEISVTINKHWFLKSTSGDKTEPLVIRVTNPVAREATYTYEITGTPLRGDLYRDNNMAATIIVDELPADSYNLRVTRRDGIVTSQSRQLQFFVSHPVYVAWTLDWEGWDVPDSTLTMIDNISNGHNQLPVTHFWNPRIYLPEVVALNRSNELTAWLKKRVTFHHDEIGMHLHMHTDMVKKAGVTPKEEPRWNFSDASSGYDVLTTAYSADEIQKILSWSLTQFLSQGLETPRGYRAGGWFADARILSVLYANGFWYDSSGRDERLWNGSYKSPWHLTTTTQPFYPSEADANTPDSDRIGILEIPNNGGNTYEHTSEQLVTMLTQNYTEGQVSEEPKAITFVSHPQWATKEFPKIENALHLASRLSYTSDNGPIVFSTQRTIYEQWKQ